MDSFNLTRTALLTLFRETFEGVAEGNSGTWFVEGREGMFDAVEQATAQVASRQAGEGISTLAAHADHARYYLWISNQNLRSAAGEPTIFGDWKQSWEHQVVSEAKWQEIRLGLRSEFELFVVLLDELVSFRDQDQVTYLLANLAHAAFHLGAMRQILKLSTGN